MRAAGTRFEQQAWTALERAGLVLLARNYTSRYGEIDLIARDGDSVVFVEVRQRAGAAHGDAAASVTPAKQARLIRTARLWLAAHPEHAWRACRFDVVSFDGAAARMRWLRGAFEAE
ncbi:MAG: YraN family protein [Fulvimonas sp.]|nr:YraN family protein [Fulvimonas sp.]